MIVRIWHGYTTMDNALKYETLLKNEVIEGILEMKVNGFQKIEVLKRPQSGRMEFVTIMWFDNLEAVKKFAGEDYEKCYVPEAARKVLSDFDMTSQHYELTYATGPEMN